MAKQDYIIIGEKIHELRCKLDMLKASGANKIDLVRVAKGIIFAFEAYDKAKFGKKKTNVSLSGLIR